MLVTYGVKKHTARKSTNKFYEFIRERPQDPADINADVDTWRTILWKQALGPKLATFAPSAYEMWRTRRLKHFKLTPDLEVMLMELRKDYKLGLVTNGPSASQWEKVHRIGGELFFDAIVVSGDVQREKPHPLIFEEAFRRLDVSPMECLMVGDKLETDIKGGIKSNCAATVWLTSNKDPMDAIQPKPDFRIDDLLELPRILPSRSLFTSLCAAQSLGFYHRLRDEPRPTWRKKLQW